MDSDIAIPGATGASPGLVFSVIKGHQVAGTATLSCRHRTGIVSVEMGNPVSKDYSGTVLVNVQHLKEKPERERGAEVPARIIVD